MKEHTLYTVENVDGDYYMFNVDDWSEKLTGSCITSNKTLAEKVAKEQLGVVVVLAAKEKMFYI